MRMVRVMSASYFLSAAGAASGTSVATVRLLAVKYCFATRCTSAFVTFAKSSAAVNSFL